VELRSEGGAGTSDPRTDGPDGAADDVGSVRVRQAQQLRQHQRLTLVRRKVSEELGRRNDALVVRRRRKRRRVRRVGAATCPLANVIEADVSADAEDPREHRSAFPPIEMGDNSEQRLLREVVGFAGAGEVCTEAPDVALYGADEPFERCPVACLSGGCDSVEVDHTDQSAASGPVADTAPTCSSHVGPVCLSRRDRCGVP